MAEGARRAALPDFDERLVAVRGAMTAGLAGAVLAGGESRRMGEDKALLVVAGEPLWRRQARVLTEAGAAPVIVVRRAGQPELGAAGRVVHDEFAGIGPLAGWHAALQATSAEAAWLAVVAVDLPAIDAAWFAELWARCGPGVGAVARHAAGFEPLAAIYPREALGVVVAQVERGEFSLQKTVARLVSDGRMAVRELAEGERARLRNWNTPADRAG